MGLPVFLAGVVAVVGGHQGQVQFPGQLDIYLPGGIFFGKVMTLELQVEATGEDLGQLQGSLAGSLHITADGILLHFPFQAGRRADEPLAVLSEQGLVYPGPIIEALQITDGYQLSQVAQAGFILRQQDQVVITPAGASGGLLVTMIAFGDVGLAAEDGLDARLDSCLVKRQHAEQVAMLGDGHPVHIEVAKGVENGIDGLGAVQQGEVGMVVEMDEVSHAQLMDVSDLELRQIDSQQPGEDIHFQHLCDPTRTFGIGMFDQINERV
ncbi:hypothetical protein ES703_24574 [subsurface metagenome]